MYYRDTQLFFSEHLWQITLSFTLQPVERTLRISLHVLKIICISQIAFTTIRRKRSIVANIYPIFAKFYQKFL